MLKKLLFISSLLCLPFFAYGTESDGTYSVTALLEREANSTPCATKIFTKALNDTVPSLTDTKNNAAPQDADSNQIDMWIHSAFAHPDILQAVLQCPELARLDDDDTIVFEPVSYTFPNGRTITVNYETQKKVMQQRLLLATKPALTDAGIAPDIVADTRNGIIWINVDPAWYAILVAEHGSLDEYVGPDKKNILALDYIEKNISQFYPKDHAGVFRADCTSRSAIAGDTDMINRAATITVGGPPPHADTKDMTKEEKKQAKIAKNNDYYVMGETNLQWIAALELVGDVVLTIVTGGVYLEAKSALMGARAVRAVAKSSKLIEALAKSPKVAKWIKTSNNVTHLERVAKITDKAEDSYQAISKLERNSTQTVKNLNKQLEVLKSQKADAKTIKAVEDELKLATKQATTIQEATKSAEKIANLERTLKNDTKLTDLEKQKLIQEIADLKKTYSNQLKAAQKMHADDLATLGKADDVKDYQDLVQAKRDAAHTAYMLRRGKIAFQSKRGLLPVRAFKAAKSLRAGLKSSNKLNKSTKVVRANMSGASAKLNDWLFHNTMKNLTVAASVPFAIQALKVGVKIIGGLYDFTDISTGEYTNDINMKPYLLLGADNLKGYENVVNQGMWLFWAGSSTSAADDDAAFLQAMDFAEKFHQDLVETQDEYNVMACDVDIYVVRPIIRNYGTPNAELYYLFMNETPWTTHGYNQPNDGTGETSIPRKAPENEPESATPQPSGVTTETVMVNNDDTQNIANTQNSRSSQGIGTYTEPSYDGTKIGQGCTKPSAGAGVFSNEILTTGRYATVSPAFEKAMITKFRTEGGCVNHPEDAGGYTCYGVSSKYFPQVKNPGFSRADAEDIAYNNFYKKYHLDQLPDAISGDVFMALWGTGSRPASIGVLQNLLGVPQTNVVDDATINAAKTYQGDLRTQFLDKRQERFTQGQAVFRQGWLNALDVYRANGCHTVAGETVP